MTEQDLPKYIDEKTIAEQQTPLHIACKLGSVNVVECLINELNAYKEARDYQMRTPLYLAAEYSKFYSLNKHYMLIYSEIYLKIIKQLLKY